MEKDVLSFLFVVKKELGAPLGFESEWDTQKDGPFVFKVKGIKEGHAANKNKWLCSLEDSRIREHTLRRGDYIMCVNGETDPKRMQELFVRKDRNYFIRVARLPDSCDGDAAGGRGVKQDAATPSSPSRGPQAAPVASSALLPLPGAEYPAPPPLPDGASCASEATCHPQQNFVQPSTACGAQPVPPDAPPYSAAPPPQQPPPLMEPPAPAAPPPAAPWPAAPPAQQPASPHQAVQHPQPAPPGMGHPQQQAPPQQQQQQRAQQEEADRQESSEGAIQFQGPYTAVCDYVSEGNGYASVQKGALLQVARDHGELVKQPGNPTDRHAEYIYVQWHARNETGWAPLEVIGACGRS